MARDWNTVFDADADRLPARAVEGAPAEATRH
jgi:hypothetical protein